MSLRKINLLEINPKALYRELREKGFPVWFIVLNVMALVPIVVWPLFAFTSVFLFDNPKNFVATFIIFLGIISYPVFLLLMARLSFRWFAKEKFIAILLPLIPIVLVVYLLATIA